MKTLILMILTFTGVTQAETVDQINSSPNKGSHSYPNFSETERIIKKRLPNSFIEKGIDQNGSPCRISFIYNELRALGKQTFEVTIQNLSSKTTLDGSWYFYGGRDGCGSVPINYPNRFFYRQDSGSDYPCFGSAHNLSNFTKADFNVSVINSKKTLFSLKTDKQLIPNICIVGRSGILQPNQ